MARTAPATHKYRRISNQSDDEFLDITTELTSYKLPANLWGAVVFVGLNTPPKACQIKFHYMTTLLPGLICCLGMQASFIYHVTATVLNSEQSCSAGDHPLRLLCLAVLAFSMTREFAETFELIFFMHQFPWYEDKDEDKLNDERAGFFYKTIKTLEVAVPLTGITLFQLLCVYFMMSIKGALGCALLYVSSAYIVHADSNEDMILNSVAMLFVIDVDELLYTIIVPDYIRRRLDSMLPLVADPETWNNATNAGRELAGYLKMHCKLWTGVVTTGFMWWSWCRTTYGLYDIQHAVSLGAWAGAVCVALCCILPCFAMCCIISQGAVGERVGDTGDIAKTDVRKAILKALGKDASETRGEDASESAEDA